MFEDQGIMGDNWGWLPTDAIREPYINNNTRRIQEPSTAGSTENPGGRGRIRPIPISPYGQSLYSEVMDQYQPLSPINLNFSNPPNQHNDNRAEQICNCNCHGLGLHVTSRPIASNQIWHTTDMIDNIATTNSTPTVQVMTDNQNNPALNLEQNTNQFTITQMFETIQQNQMVLLTNIGSFQRATEERLLSLETKAGGSFEYIKTLNSNIEAAKVNIVDLTTLTNANNTKVKTMEDTLTAAVARIDKLENDVLDLDRVNRAYSLRILNVPEEPREICRVTVANIIRDNKLLPNCENLTISTIANQIENAHRLGKTEAGRTRHLLVKFHEVPFRDTVIRTVKRLPGGKTHEGYIFLDDLSVKDREIKNRNSDITASHFAHDRSAVLYKGGQFKLKGRWFSEDEYQRTRPRQ